MNPKEIGTPGHKSLTSKIKGIFRILQTIKHGTAIVNGVDVAYTTSGLGKRKAYIVDLIKNKMKE